jgi:adenylosuccinate synthase
VLAAVRPVYEDVAGWGRALTEARDPGALPGQARRFIEVVEEQVGIPVRVVGVGAERDDYLLWVS